MLIVFALIFINEIGLEFSCMHNSYELLHLFFKSYIDFCVKEGFLNCGQDFRKHVWLKRNT